MVQGKGGTTVSQFTLDTTPRLISQQATRKEWRGKYRPRIQLHLRDGTQLTPLTVWAANEMCDTAREAEKIAQVQLRKRLAKMLG